MTSAAPTLPAATTTTTTTTTTSGTFTPTFPDLASVPLLLFNKQADAFEAADAAWASWEALVASADAGAPRAVLLVVSAEDAASGRRQFAAAELASFATHYLDRVTPTARHYYEIIREARPCRLYLDVEFKPDELGEPTHRGPALVDAVLLHVARELRDALGVLVSREHFLVLDSSTPEKFSQHVVLHLPDERLFSSNAVCGALVERAVARAKGAGDELAAAIVDLKVYTRNRAFRLLYSSKFGRTAALEPARECARRFFRGVDEDSCEGALRLFRDSLVCPLGAAGPLPRDLVLEGADALLGGEPPSAPRALAADSAAGARAPRASSMTHGASPFPLLDEFIRRAASRAPGPPAEIREWSRSGSTLVYGIARNRYCERIARQHRSNHVFYVVDLAGGQARQMCTDRDCRGFASAPIPVPGGVLPSASAWEGAASERLSRWVGTR